MKQNKKKKIWLVLAVICCTVALISGGIGLRSYIIKNNAQKEREKLAEVVNALPEQAEEVKELTNRQAETEDESEKSWEEYTLEEKYQAYLHTYDIEIPQKDIDFEELQESVNEDIYAWIYIPGTDVDDPVVQHPTDDTYYLNYNLDGSKGYPGGIYTESCNNKEFSDRMTVIYGHNMKNRKGFGSLHNFGDEAVFDENRYIFIYLPDDIKVYEIFAAYEGSSNHIIYGHEWDDISWVQYLSDTLLLNGEKDNALDAYEFYADDLVLTLSTCVRNSPNERYLVQGVLLDEAR